MWNRLNILVSVHVCAMLIAWKGFAMITTDYVVITIVLITTVIWLIHQCNHSNTFPALSLPQLPLFLIHTYNHTHKVTTTYHTHTVLGMFLSSLTYTMQSYTRTVKCYISTQTRSAKMSPIMHN